MKHPQIVSQEEWLVAREALLIQEKEATRARDQLNAERRRLPMVKIDEDWEEPPGRSNTPAQGWVRLHDA